DVDDDRLLWLDSPGFDLRGLHAEGNGADEIVTRPFLHGGQPPAFGIGASSLRARRSVRSADLHQYRGVLDRSARPSHMAGENVAHDLLSVDGVTRTGAQRGDEDDRARSHGLRSTIHGWD